MKRIFTLLVALVAFGFAGHSRTCNLALINTLRNVDTIYYNNTGAFGKVMATGFVNLGPDAILSTDTIIWKSAYNGTVALYFTGTSGIPANDTVAFVDTVLVTAAPTTNPFTWCDSIWAKDNTNTIISDPNTANNKVCKTVLFVHATGVQNVTVGDKNISIYPNPANNELNVEYVFGTNDEATLVMRDLLGKAVLQQNLGKNLNGRQKYPLNVSNLANGVYMLEINTAHGRAMTKVVVQK